jgi:hypothetical protein
MQHEEAHIGWLITSGVISGDAKKRAGELNEDIYCMEGLDFARLIVDNGLKVLGET